MQRYIGRSRGSCKTQMRRLGIRSGPLLECVIRIEMRRRQIIAFLLAIASICVLAMANRDVTNDRKFKYYKPGSSQVSPSTSKVPETNSISPTVEADSISTSSSTENFDYITPTLKTVSHCTAIETADCPSPKCDSSEMLCPSEIDLKTTPECPSTDTVTVTKTRAVIMGAMRCPVTSPCNDPSQDVFRAVHHKPEQDATKPPEYTTAQRQEFDCRIIPTTETVTFSKTRAAPIETVATYETLTKTPTVTNTVFTSCSPDCVSVSESDVIETTTTALFTEYEVTMQCDSPPIIYTDTLTLYSTQVLPVRNVDTVTITVTPVEPVTYFTSTYYIGTYADKVVEDLYLDCVLPPPCKGFEAKTVTETSTIETATETDTLCLDNWSFYHVTSTMTEYSCFNPFSIYACADGGVCPLPTVITETIEVADSTVTLTDKVNYPCNWGQPPLTGFPVTEYSTPQNPLPTQDATPSFTVMVSVTVECPSVATSSLSSTAQLAQLIAESNQIFLEIELLLRRLISDVNSMFPDNRMKVGVNRELLNRLTKAKYTGSLANLRRSDLVRLFSRHKEMILSLSRFAKDAERIKANPKLFFDQLEVLVQSLEKTQSYRGKK